MQPPVPPSSERSLRSLLDGLQALVVGADVAVPAALEGRLLAGPIPGFDVAERLNVYRHAYRARLVEALRETFGHGARYLDAQFDGHGESAFERLARAYVEAHPSSVRSINVYGADWPAWLAAHLSRWPEVAELATLDWHLRRAFDGPDSRPLDLRALAALVGGPDWERTPLRPVPTLRCLTFSTNALALWNALDRDQTPPAAVLLDAPQTVVVWRVGEQPHFRSVDRFEAVAFEVLARHGSFGEICAQLADAPLPAGSQQMPLAEAAGLLLRRWIDESVLADA